jgi:hypothetical protein
MKAPNYPRLQIKPSPLSTGEGPGVRPNDPAAEAALLSDRSIPWLKRRVYARDVPASWHGLSQEQFIKIAQALRHPDPMEQRVLITAALLGLGWTSPLLWAAIRWHLSPVEQSTLLGIADPFMNADGFDATPVQYLSPPGRFAPFSLGEGTGLRVCEPNLIDRICARSWGQADGYFLRYGRMILVNKEAALEPLQKLVATIYASRSTSREARLQGASLPVVQRLPIEKLQAVLLMWSGQRRILEKECPHVFSRGAENKVASGRQGWADVLRSMAPDITRIDQAGQIPARQFLRALDDRIKETKRLHQEAEERKRKRR